jgi:outer membrane receptor protein involved in Fe transport
VQLALSGNTAVTLIGEFTEDDYQADFGTAIDLRGELTAPIEKVSNHPRDRIRRHQYTFGADIVHRFSGAWHLTARARHFDGGYAFGSLWLPISLNLATNIYTQLALQQEQRNNEEAVQLGITGNSAIAGRPITLVAGADYRRSTTDRITRLDATSLNFLNWANPDYSRRPPDTESLPVAPGFRAGEDIDRIGLFANTRTEVTDAFSVNLGGRRHSGRSESIRRQSACRPCRRSRCPARH